MLISVTLCRVLMSVSLLRMRAFLRRDVDDHGGTLQAALAGVVDRAVGAGGVEGEAGNPVAPGGGGDVEGHPLPPRHRAAGGRRRPLERRPRRPGAGALRPT